MKRALSVALAAGAIVLLTASGLFTASGAAAGTSPRNYPTIPSTHGFAAATQVVGCEQADVFVSSSVAMYAAQPGPVGKQGLTALYVRITDICSQQVPPTAVKPAAGGGGGTVILEVDLQNGARLMVDPRLNTASVTTRLTGTDAEGNSVTVDLTAHWTATGPLQHTTDRTHVLYPGEGVVTSTANDLRRPAEAQVTVTIGSRTITATTTDANLEQTKSHCIEVPRPGVEGFYPCFGFPG